MKQICLFIGLVFFTMLADGQGYNPDPNKTYVNMDLPRTPESQGFEKYGNYAINEISGLPNISVPIYTVQGKFLSVPISLSYHAGGIKVSQEATWVGLGFDLMVGGRITVEVKGRRDNEVSAGLLGGNRLATYIPQIFNRLGDTSYRSILTVASPGEGFADAETNPGYDDEKSVRMMAGYGLGEPDIYHANFGENSFKFYYDVVDKTLKFLGEKNLFSITNTTNSNGEIVSWVVMDNSGNTNYFTQKEISTCHTPPIYDPNAFSTTTAWLLTKIIHPTGDSIVFRYSTFGQIFPAYDWQASLSGVYGGGATPSPDNSSELNRMKLEPAYLTQIESNNVFVNFILSERSDIKGAARKLDEIRVLDKNTDAVIKKYIFGYNYFEGHIDPIMANEPDSVKNWSKLRLKLNTLTINDSVIQPPYRFYYNSNTTAPGKYTFCQDHWGYLNNINHDEIYDPYPSPQSLIPSMTSLVSEGIETAPPTGYLPSNNGSANRQCNSTAMITMTMDSIVYPTGGSTKFIYSPHHSDYYGENSDLVGGGLRIETLKTYDEINILAGRTNYIYEGGFYQGTINYFNYDYSVGKGVLNGGSSGVTTRFTLSANGLYNKNDLIVAYSKVTQELTDQNNQANNGKLVKYYKVPSVSIMNNLKPLLMVAHYPYSSPVTGCTGASSCIGTEQFNYPWYCLPPEPHEQLDGKLLKEEYVDSAGAIIKSVNYYYKQVNYTKNLYSIKVKDNVEGGVAVSGPLTYPTAGTMGGIRRYVMVVSPAKAYFTQTDSIIEKIYQGSNFITQKKTNSYNSFNQVEFTTSYNSDGTQSITYVKTPLSFTHPSVPSPGEGEALLIDQMKGAHLYDLPIEQIAIKRNTAGDSMVTGGIYQTYFNGSVKNTYALETKVPLPFRSEFKPTYYYHDYPTLPSFNLVKDSRYKLQERAEYYPGNLLKDLESKQIKKSFIWDSIYNTVLAQCINATSNNIAFSSFEAESQGNWSYSGNVVFDTSSPTGKKAYNLSSAEIIKPALDDSTTYLVSYWYKSGASVVITGGTELSSSIGRNVGLWTYKEHKITGATSIEIAGSGFIDELRLYPKGAMMTTYSYKPLIGLQSQCDVNSSITYYEYDRVGRVQHIRDQDKNLLKKFDYRFQSCPIHFENGTTSKVFFKSTCGTGYVSSPVNYTIPKGKYTSCVSKEECDIATQNDLETNGAAYANDPENGASCNSCSGSFSVGTGWVNYSQSITPNSSAISLSLALGASNTSSFDNIGAGGEIIGTLVSCCRPSETRSFSCNESGRYWSVTIYTNGEVRLVRTGGAALPSANQGFTISGSYNL